jgi:hypothetical protein
VSHSVVDLFVPAAWSYLFLLGLRVFDLDVDPSGLDHLGAATAPSWISPDRLGNRAVPTSVAS